MRVDAHVAAGRRHEALTDRLGARRFLERRRRDLGEPDLIVEDRRLARLERATAATTAARANRRRPASSSTRGAVGCDRQRQRQAPRDGRRPGQGGPPLSSGRAP